MRIDQVAHRGRSSRLPPTGGGPGTKTYTASYYLYTLGFTQFHLSMATAGSWIFLILTSLVVTLLVRRLLKAEQA